MCRVMRACVDTVGFIVIRTEVASRGLGAYLGDFSAGTCGIVGLHLEGMHVDISIGTIVGAQAAADAPVLNCDFELFRLRIDPTGHPTMHKGSLHCRQEVATR